MIRYYGQYNPHLDQIIHEKYFQNKLNGFFIECGAWEGVQDSTCKVFEEFFGWKGINVEASPIYFNKLHKTRPQTTNVHAALTGPGPSGRMGKFYSFDMPRLHEAHGLSSIAPEIAMTGIVKPGTKAYEYVVPFISYGELAAKYKFSEVDLFVLDIEGAELDALRGIHEGPLPKVFCIEYNLVGIDNIAKILEPLGYRADGTYDVNVFFVRP